MTREPVLLSIVIPTLDEAQTLLDCLQRLQPLRAQKVEIIVADGGGPAVSTLDTLTDQHLRCAKGRAVQMNCGADAASGCWLLFLHADTELPGDVDSWLLQLAQSPAQWGFFRLILDGSPTFFRLIEWCINRRSSLTSVATGDQCLFVRRAVFNAVGGYPAIALMEDVALSKTLRSRATPLIWPSPVVTSSRRWQQKGILKTVLLMWILRFSYFVGVSPSRLATYYRG